MKLNKYAKNVHSQFGEDGIIQQILSTLPNCDGWCVEFGAWDGKFLSNTCRLIEEDGYSAVLVEGNPVKFSELQKNFANFPKVFAIQKMIDFETNRLEDVLATTPIPKDFDFLSIDIDGCDYHIWQNLEKYHPKVVCIEFNPTCGVGVEFIQERNFQVSAGASLAALIKLGKTKGYELIATTRNNGFFVRQEHYSNFCIQDNSEATLRSDVSWVSHVFSTYDGQLMVVGSNLNPWNGVALHRMIRQLPKFLHFFPESAPTWKRKLLGAWKKIQRLNHKG
jgi:hypothetical protein